MVHKLGSFTIVGLMILLGIVVFQPPVATVIAGPVAMQEDEGADNSWCTVCHINLQDEKLVAIHQPIGTGCEQCHGISDNHSADEDGITAPDKMFPRDGIIEFCQGCHPDEVLLAKPVHKVVLTGKNAGKKVCTDCHGKHKLENRTRIWNKKTGELTGRDGTPLMDKVGIDKLGGEDSPK